MASTLVGREEEVAVGVILLESLTQGKGSVLFVEGPPGVGKTVFAKKVVEAAHARSWPVLYGGLIDGQDLPSLWPWKRLLSKARAILDLHSGEPWLQLRRVHAPLLECLDRPLAEAPSLQALTESGRSLRFFEWTSAFLTGLAALVPLVLVLEDLHNSDEASLNLLDYLIDELEFVPVFFLLSTRLGGEFRGPGVPRLRERLEFSPLRRVITLGNFSEHDLQAVLAQSGRLSDQDGVRHVWARTGGVPLRVALYLELGGELSKGRAAESFELQYWTRVREGLSPDAGRTVLRLAALGNSLSRWEVKALAPAGLDSPILDELLRASVLREERDQLSFFHDVLRTSLLGQLSPAERRDLVAEVASLLEAHLDPASERTAALLKELYLALPSPHFTDRAFQICQRAVSLEKAQGAWPEVIRDWERLMEAHGSNLDAESQTTVQVDLCLAHLHSFNMSKGIVAFRETWNLLFQRRDWDTILELLDPAIHLSVGFVGAENPLVELINQVPDSHPRKPVAYLAYGEALFMWMDRFEEGRASVRTAFELARRARQERLELRALAFAAYHDTFARRFEASLAACDNLLGQRQRLDPDTWGLVLVTRVHALLGLGRMAECHGATLDLIRLTKAYPSPFYRMIAQRELQRFDLRAGDWTGVASFRSDDPLYFFFRTPQLVARLLTGDFATADADIEMLLNLIGPGGVEEAGLQAFLTWILAIRVYITGESKWGDYAVARAGAGRAGSQSLRHRVDFAACLGRLAPLLGEEEARRAYEGFAEAEPYYFEEEEYTLAAAQGLLALRWGDRALARRHFEDAVRLCDKYDEKPWRAWYQWELAQVTEDPARSRALADQALAAAQALGLAPLERRIESRPAVPSTLPAGLTLREQEVLRLLVRGWSDKEMASQLHVSPFTVGNHLRNIYAKIGRNNRGEAAHWALTNGVAVLEP